MRQKPPLSPCGNNEGAAKLIQKLSRTQPALSLPAAAASPPAPAAAITAGIIANGPTNPDVAISGAGAPLQARSRIRLVTIFSASPLLPAGPVVTVQTVVPSVNTVRVILAVPLGPERMTSTRLEPLPASPCVRLTELVGRTSAERVPSAAENPAPRRTTEAAAAINCDVT